MLFDDTKARTHPLNIAHAMLFLLEQGKKTSVEEIRATLGGGSPNDISANTEKARAVLAEELQKRSAEHQIGFPQDLWVQIRDIHLSYAREILDKDRALLEKDQSALADERTNLEKQQAEQQQSLGRLESERDSLKAQLEDSKSNHQKDVDRLNGEVTELRKKIDELRKNESSLSGKFAAEESARKQAEHIRDDLQKKLEKQSLQLEDNEKTIEDVQLQLVKADSQAKNYHEQLKQEKTNFAQRESGWLTDRDKLKSELQGTNDQLSNEIAARAEKDRQLTESHGRLSQLEQSLSDSQTESTKLSAKLESASEQIEGLRQMLNDANSRIDDLKDANTELKIELNEKRKEGEG